MLDQLPIGIVAADRSGAIMDASRFARRIRQDEDPPWTDATKIADYSTWPLFRADGSRYGASDLPLACALRGEIVANEEIRSASDRTYSVTAGPVCDPDGKIVAAVAAFVDISERKRGEKERELFIGALGHDLRNPLQAITMAADSLVLRPDVPSEAKKPAARISSSAHRMNRLICDLLDFARSQHGAIPITPEHCQLREIAAEVIAEIKLAEPDREIRVEPEWDPLESTCRHASLSIL